MALTDALDEMVVSGVISPIAAMKVLQEFDKSVCEAIRMTKVKANIKGRLHTYRFCGNVWTFLVEDASVHLTETDSSTREFKLKLLKVVACDSKLAENDSDM
jgi:transcription initiation factor TFIIA small subunit